MGEVMNTAWGLQPERVTGRWGGPGPGVIGCVPGWPQDDLGRPPGGQWHLWATVHGMEHRTGEARNTDRGQVEVDGQGLALVTFTDRFGLIPDGVMFHHGKAI